MKRNDQLIESLLDKIESMEVGGGATVTAQQLFYALNGISPEGGVHSAILAVHKSGELVYEQKGINYHLGLLLDDGLVTGSATQTYEDLCIVVNGLTSKGHQYLEEVRKKRAGVLASVVSFFKEKAPEWTARVLFTSAVKWIVGVIGIYIAAQIPAVRAFMADTWSGLVGAWSGHAR
jgi:hypothetical protein